MACWGVVMLTVLVVNVTPLQVKVSLSPRSADVRQLAAVVNLNTPPGKDIGNYRLSPWNPQHAMFFYSHRHLAYPIKDPEKLQERIAKNPRSTWLTSSLAFEELKEKFPDEFYLIQANGKYAYFTSAGNRENVRYDFSEMSLPVVR